MAGKAENKPEETILEKKTNKSKITIKRKQNTNTLQEKAYRLCNSRTGESFLLKVGRDKQLVIYDEKVKRNRVIRHAPNEQSIYLDMQTNHAYVETIEFQYGRLVVEPTSIITKEFLDAHPDNKKNGGRIFEEENEEVQAVNDIESDELRQDIKYRIRTEAKNGEEGLIVLERLVSSLIGSVAEARKMDVAALKRRLYIEADANPSFFTGGDNKNEITAFDDNFLEVKYIVLAAINDGVISVNSALGTVKWTKGDTNIISVSRGKDIVDEFANFLIMEENQLTMTELIQRL